MTVKALKPFSFFSFPFLSISLSADRMTVNDFQWSLVSPPKGKLSADRMTVKALKPSSSRIDAVRLTRLQTG